MMEEEFSAEAMRGISQSARAINMREKYKDIVYRVNAAALEGKNEIILDNKEDFCYELFDWLKNLGFCITYIRRGYDIKSNLWDSSNDLSNYLHADWVRVAW